MSERSVWIFLIVAAVGFGQSATAHEANNVTIVELHSANSHGHTWVKISGNSTCAPYPYYIIERWDDQPEPLKTYRKQMYQITSLAFAMGKPIRVIGANCYLGNYLFAEQVIILN